MKTLFVFILVFLTGVSFVEAQGPKRPKAKSMKPVMAYEADYSSKFSIADDTYSAIVLELWKDYEEGDFERHIDYFSEDIVAEIPNGDVITGRENLISSAEAYRGSLTNFTTKLLSWVSLRSDDREENWVAVWGEDSFTDEKGENVKHSIHEIWRFNNEGKIDYMKQYVVIPKE